MKKIIISILAITVLVFSGCFIDSDTATVRINLGNMPVAKVEKKSIFDRIVMLFVKEAVAQEEVPGEYVRIVHLGAFDEANQLVTKKSISIGNFPDNTTVSFDVPAGIRRKIVVLGENHFEYIGYHGVSDEVDLVAGAVVTVEIGMGVLDIDYVNIMITGSIWPNPARADWDHVLGASLYNLQKVDWEGTPEGEPIAVSNNFYEFQDGGGYFEMEIVFGFADRNSNKLPLGDYIS